LQQTSEWNNGKLHTKKTKQLVVGTQTIASRTVVRQQRRRASAEREKMNEIQVVAWEQGCESNRMPTT